MLTRGARVTRRDFISGRPAAIVGSAIADTPVTGAFPPTSRIAALAGLQPIKILRRRGVIS
jgi:hypothetical protein